MSEHVRTEAHGEKCARPIFSGGPWYRPHLCGKRAKIIEDGSPYCGIHDPEKDRKRRAAWDEKWDAERKAQRESERRTKAMNEYFYNVPTEEIEALVKAKRV